MTGSAQDNVSGGQIMGENVTLNILGAFTLLMVVNAKVVKIG